MSALPRSGTRGLGRPLSAGAIRVPRPAHRTIAVFSVPAIPQPPRPSSARQRAGAQLWREMAIVPCAEAIERGRPQVSLEISPGARDILQVLRFAVPLQEAQPEPKEAGVALSAEVGIGRGKGAGLERGLARRGLGAIMLEKFAFERGRHAGARILEQ